MGAFSKAHPLTQLVFYSVTLIFVIAFNNPFISAVSLICALIYEKKIKNIGFSAAVIAAVSLFNFLFAHYGSEILFTVNEIPFTLNSLFYGFTQGMTVAAVLLWFTAFGRGMDSEKLLWLFRFSPKLALMFSMILGFIPRFLTKQKEIREAQKALGDAEKTKFQTALQSFSALVTYSLESSIVTADSMKARGYNPKAQRAGRFRFYSGDAVLLAAFTALAIYVAAERIAGNISFVFEPQIYIFKAEYTCSYLLFYIIEIMPFTVDLLENIRWKQSGAKA